MMTQAAQAAPPPKDGALHTFQPVTKFPPPAGMTLEEAWDRLRKLVAMVEFHNAIVIAHGNPAHAVDDAQFQADYGDIINTINPGV